MNHGLFDDITLRFLTRGDIFAFDPFSIAVERIGTIWVSVIDVTTVEGRTLTVLFWKASGLARESGDGW